jgi:hypothetical protein
MPPEPRSGRDNPYYGYSTPMISGRLRDLVGEMGVRPMYKTLRLAELVEWVMHDLPESHRMIPARSTPWSLRTFCGNGLATNSARYR